MSFLVRFSALKEKRHKYPIVVSASDGHLIGIVPMDHNLDPSRFHIVIKSECVQPSGHFAAART